MAPVRANRSWRVTGLLATSALCAVVAVGMAKWPEIEFELGFAYANGNFHGWTPGFAREHRKAAQWLARAAQANHPRAQYMLGLFHAHGWGLPRDVGQSVEWFTKSARNGYAPAAYHLGWMYHKGDGLPRDDEQAIRFLEQAAGQGMVAAHLALGRFYEHGEAMPADSVQALKRYVLAVHFARTLKTKFDNAAYAKQAQAAQKELVARMDSLHVEQGRALALQWLANHP